MKLNFLVNGHFGFKFEQCVVSRLVAVENGGATVISFRSYTLIQFNSSSVCLFQATWQQIALVSNTMHMMASPPFVCG